VIWLFFLLFAIFPRPSLATDPIVKITNFSSNSSPEWVELYNQTPDFIDLSNWSLGDSNTTVIYDLPLTGCLAPNTYQTFFHNGSWLNDSGDIIYLYDSQNTLIDTYSYATGKLELSYRSTNTCVPSLALSPIPPTSTPTTPPLPTITPSPVPPTSIPPSNTPVPTSTLVPTIKPSPTLYPTDKPLPTENYFPTNEPLPTDSPESAILGQTTTVTPPISPKNFISPKIISIGFIIIGGLLLLVPIIIIKIKK